jgi:hypothetical protein
MPRNALRQVDADHCVSLSQMGALLTVLTRGPFGKRQAVLADIAVEAKIAERVLSDLPSVNKLGEQAPFNCPGCGGVLWQVGSGKSLRFRCHVGHAYTAPVLLSDQSAKIEETLWVALRMFEERRNLLLRMKENNSIGSVMAASERIKDSEIHIDRIKSMLKADETYCLGSGLVEPIGSLALRRSEPAQTQSEEPASAYAQAEGERRAGNKDERLFDAIDRAWRELCFSLDHSFQSKPHNR